MEQQQKMPNQKAVVQMLTQFLREKPKSFMTKRGQTVQKTYTILQCPNELCKQAGREICFQKNSGFVNAFNHLKTCIADGKAEQLYDIYYDNLKMKQKQGLDSHFKPSVLRVTAKVQALHDYIRMIVFKNLPLSVVEDDEFRSFAKHGDRFSARTLKEVMFKMVELVENAIATEIKAAKCGSILHDGWTCGGVHYIGIFACYPREVGSVTYKRSVLPHRAVELSLLSCSPMAKLRIGGEKEYENEDQVGTNDEEAVNFCARTHMEHIKAMFLFYNVDVCDWAVWQIADNCRVNRSVARLMGIPHVGCKSHLLNLEVNHMVSLTKDLERTLQSVHETMNQCKQRLKNAALLRNLVDLRPIIHNKTRWSGKYFMLERFLRIRDELIQVSQDEGSDLTVSGSLVFRNKVIRYCKQLRQINYSTKYLQTRKLTLGRCRESLNMLMEDVQVGFGNNESDLYRCFLGKKYIANDAEIIPDADFEGVVSKIQSDDVNLMTHREHAACHALLLTGEQQGESSAETTGTNVPYEEGLHRRKKRRSNPR